MERKLHYIAVAENKDDARAKAETILADTYRSDVRIGTIVDATLFGDDRRPRHPETHRELPAETRAYDVEAFVTGPDGPHDWKPGAEGPLPPGMGPPGSPPPGTGR